MKPINWKDIEIRRFHAKEKTVPAGKPSIMGSSEEPYEGACMVVSQ